MNATCNMAAAAALVLVSMAGVARADDAASSAKALDPVSLGHLDAALTACEKADAENRAVYRRLRTENVVFGEGTKHEMRAPGADSPEYKAAYAEAQEAAGRQSEAELVAACHASFLAETKPAG